MIQKTKPNRTKTSITLLVWAMLVCSCGKTTVAPEVADGELVPTQVSYNHTIMQSKDGVRSYRMETPILEKYDEAAEPFIEFKKGIKVENFGSADSVESDLVADYARFDVNKELWEARGNVVARNLKDDKILYTEQLFWDQKLKKIYTDLPTKVLDRGYVNKGVGFEADEKFESFQFNRGRGRIEVNTPADSTKQNVADSTQVDRAANVNESSSK